MKGIKEDVKLLEMRVLKATYEHIKIWGKMNMRLQNKNFQTSYFKIFFYHHFN